METVADSGGDSKTAAMRTPASAASAADEAKRWVEYAFVEAAALKADIAVAADSAVATAGSSVSKILSASSAALQETKGLVEWAKNEYAVYEDMAVGKIKEGIYVAASHPSLFCGIAAGMGIVAFKRPRGFLVRNTRRLFMSDESLLSDAEAKVSELRQSINLLKNESRKLEERALKAEEEMERGRKALIKEGREIRGELRLVSGIEKEAMGLKDLISELPRRDASRFRSELSSVVSQVKREKKALTSAASKIINHGIPI